MPLRPRPDGSAAAARVAALMPARSGGWVPPPDAAGAGVADAALPSRSGESRAARAADPTTASGHEASPAALSPDEPSRGPLPPELLPSESVSREPFSPKPLSPEQLLSSPEPEPVGRSWAARAPGAHLAPVGRYRLDPGRRGAIALVLAGLLAAVVTGGVVLRNRPQEVALPVVEAAGVPLPGASAAPPAGAEVVVAVSGEVRRPGLLRLPAGSRVDDAVRAAGGALPGADLSLLNVARRLVDGEQVLVGVGPPPAVAGAGAGAAAPGGLLDLNTASASDLDALPGIGPVLAQRIVDWRTENGRFASVDQLREVTGIGEAKYGDLQAKVTV